VKDTPFEQLADQLVGPLIYGISTDPVASAKVLNDFAKDNEKIVLKARGRPGKK
jgi:large subunit ribosomal protein L10